MKTSDNEKIFAAFLEGLFGCEDFKKIGFGDNKKILDKIKFLDVKNDFSVYYRDITDMLDGYETSFCETKTKLVVEKFEEWVLKTKKTDDVIFESLFFGKGNVEFDLKNFI